MGLLGLLIWLLPSASTPDPQESSEALSDASGTEVSIPRIEKPAGRMVLRDQFEGVRLESHSPRMGSDSAVTVLIWADLTHPQFPHVQNLIGEMNHRFDDRLQWGFRHLPQDQACNGRTPVTRNSKACTVARAAQCAGESFWEFIELLAKNPTQQEELQMRRFLERVGVSAERVSECLLDGRSDEAIALDVEAAEALGIGSNGRLFVNGMALPLGINAIGLDAVIRHALGEVTADEQGRVEARRLAPEFVKSEVGTLEMRSVENFYIDAVEASVSNDGSARSVAGVVPAQASWFEAKQACERAGKRLCTLEEWRRACSGEAGRDDVLQGRRWPYADRWVATACWDSGNSRRERGFEAGQKRHCRSPEEAYDLTGNLWEWVGVTEADARLVGGSFLDGQGATCGAVLDRFGPGYSAPWSGFRCCAETGVAPTGAGLSHTPTALPFRWPSPVQSKQVLVHVVSSGCSACASPTLAIARLQESGESTPVRVVVVGGDTVVSSALVENSPLRAEAIPDPLGAFAGRLGVVTVPTTLVLKQDGEEIARMEGHSALGWADLVEGLQFLQED